MCEEDSTEAFQSMFFEFFKETNFIRSLTAQCFSAFCNFLNKTDVYLTLQPLQIN